MPAKDAFLRTLDEEHARTMKLLRALPKDKADTRAHPNIKTPKELAWTFVLERGLGKAAWSDAFKNGIPAGRTPPPPPDKWEDLVAALESANKEWRDLISSTSDEQLREKIHFFVGPKQLGEYTRMDFAWFLLHDEIHHRGQFSVLMRMCDAKVPSVYGPSEAEPWR